MTRLYEISSMGKVTTLQFSGNGKAREEVRNMFYEKPEYTDEELEELEREYEEYCKSDKFEEDMRKLLGEETTMEIRKFKTT